MTTTTLLLLFLAVITSVDSYSDDSSLGHVLTTLGLPPRRNPCLFPGVTCDLTGAAAAISLPSRGLSGTISPAFGRLTGLRRLSLAGNNLAGAVPVEISRCSDLVVLDLSRNRLQGDLGFLSRLSNLQVLSLAGNRFSGRVPQAVSSFPKLRSVDLSGNPGIRGGIPKLPLENPSIYEKTSARRREEREAETWEVDLAGKPSLVGSFPVLPLSRRVILDKTSNSTTGNSRHHQKVRKTGLWILGFLVGAVVGVLSGLVLSVLFRLILDCISGRFRTSKDPTIFSSFLRKEELSFLMKDDGLAGMEMIGRGGCGEVYRATLPGNPEKVIAIKKIKKIHVTDSATEPGEEESKLLEKGMRQLRSEIQTVGKIRHRSLLPLLAHVARPDCNFLVYEYMKNGSLQDALRKAAEGTEELPWPTRLKIAQGIAAGLEYLHTQHSHRIIHRDLKPANILLDDDLEARIADFGLAKAIPDAHTHVTTSHVAGTVGYIAPEYHQVLKFTDKCDIYSFGVILAVLVTGKMPSDEYFLGTEEMSLVKWLRNIMREGEEKAPLSEVFDPTLRGSGFEEEMVLVLKIACFCTTDDPKERPNSKDVRCMLNQIKHQHQHQHHQQ